MSESQDGKFSMSRGRPLGPKMLQDFRPNWKEVAGAGLPGDPDNVLREGWTFLAFDLVLEETFAISETFAMFRGKAYILDGGKSGQANWRFGHQNFPWTFRKKACLINKQTYILKFLPTLDLLSSQDLQEYTWWVGVNNGSVSLCFPVSWEAWLNIQECQSPFFVVTIVELNVTEDQVQGPYGQDMCSINWATTLTPTVSFQWSTKPFAARYSEPSFEVKTTILPTFKNLGTYF